MDQSKVETDAHKSQESTGDLQLRGLLMNNLAILATEKITSYRYVIYFCEVHTLILQIFLHFQDIDEFYETEKKFLVDYNSK